jgi:LEA14-like dessication related protein
MRRCFPLVGLALTSLTGCAVLRDLFQSSFAEPTLAFKSASVSDLSLGGLTLNLVYTVDNPNPLAVSLAEIDYKLEVEGFQVASGQPPGGIQIAANGASELAFPAQIRFLDFAKVVETFLKKDQAGYVASGSLGLETPLGLVRLPLRKEGQFDVPKVPDVQLEAPVIKQLGFTSATVEFPLMVTNKNAFPLPIQGLRGSVQIAGANVGQVAAQVGTLPSGMGTRVRVPLTIHFAQAATAALALQRGNAQVTFSGQLESGPTSIPIQLNQAVSFLR